MHPHTSLIHWMQKLACVLKLAGPETPLNQHALGGIKKRRKESWLPVFSSLLTAVSLHHKNTSYTSTQRVLSPVCP